MDAPAGNVTIRWRSVVDAPAGNVTIDLRVQLGSDSAAGATPSLQLNNMPPVANEWSGIGAIVLD